MTVPLSLETSAPAPATRSNDPPAGWTPHPDTGGEIDIDINYSVERHIVDETLTTIVSVFGSGEEFSLEYIKLEMVCDDGQLDLVVDDDNFRFGDHQASVTMRFDGGEPITETWQRYPGPTPGFSPADDAGWIARLDQAQRVAVQLDVAGETTALLVDVSAMFSTPVQANLDFCGQY